MKNITTLLVAAIFAAFTFNTRAQAPDPIQQAFALFAEEPQQPETNAALAAAKEALKVASPTVNTPRELEIICNRLDANVARYHTVGNHTEAEKAELTANSQAAHAAAIAALQGKPVTGERQDHIKALLTIMGNAHRDAGKKVPFADKARGYYLLGIRALAAGTPVPVSAAPSAANEKLATPPTPPAPPQANPPPVSAQQPPVANTPPLALVVPQVPVATVTVTTPPPAPAPAAPAPAKKAITRTPTAPHAAQ